MSNLPPGEKTACVVFYILLVFVSFIGLGSASCLIALSILMWRQALGG